MRTYLFDLDGTLLDSIELILKSFHHTSRLHLGRELPDDYWLAGCGTPLRTQLRTISRSNEELEAMMDTYRSFNLENHDAMAKPYPGVVEVVKKLHQDLMVFIRCYVTAVIHDTLHTPAQSVTKDVHGPLRLIT